MKNTYIKNNTTKNKSETKQKNKRIAVIVLLCFFAFCTIGSSLGLLSFFGVGLGVKTAYADSVNLSYTFEGSNLYFQSCPVLMWSGYPDNGSSNSTSNFRFSFTGYNDPVENSYRTDIVFTVGYWEQKITPYTIYYIPLRGTEESKELLPENGQFTILQEPTDNDTILTNKVLTYDFYCGLQIAENDYRQYAYVRMKVNYSNQSYFDSNVVKVELGNFPINTIELYEDYFTGGSSNAEDINVSMYHCNFVRYYDNDGDSIEFQIPVRCGAGFKTQYLYDSRTYFLTQDNDITSSDSYLQGVNKGYQDGLKDGKEQGFKEGENFAKDTWYQVGFNDGLTSENPYTFVGLLGSIIDAPIIALFGDTTLDANGNTVRVDGLLNFELLGVNLSSFLGGLLMVSLVLAVIKMII